MSSIDTTGLLPGDIVAALRSFPRRLRAALDPGPFGDEGVEARDAAAAAPASADGHSARARLAQVAGISTDAERALAALAFEDGAMLGADTPVSDPARWSTTPNDSVDMLLRDAERSLDEVVRRLESLSSATWAHAGTTRSGARVALIDLGRALVGVIADDLRAIERAMHDTHRDA